MTGIDPSADFEDARYASQDAIGGQVINWVGAASSLALVIGLTVWGWQTIQRDVSGIPVIKAILEPMRIRPDAPGGSQANHQGLSVNEVQSEGRAGDPVDQLVLAPPPLDLNANQINTSLLAAPRSQTNSSRAIAPLAPDMTPEQQKTALDAMAAALAQGATPLAPVAPAPGIAPAAMRAPQAANPLVTTIVPNVISSAIPGVARSLRPIARPTSSGLAPSIRVIQSPSLTALPSNFVDPDVIPAGTRLVQFGAFDSAQIAQNEWTRLSGRFASFLGDKSPVIQQAISGGREFHRLRVMGVEDVGDARRFCSIFLAQNTPCIPVVAK